MKLPDSIKNTVDALAELPSVGPRQAVRLAFYLIGKGRGNIDNLAHGLDDLKKIKICERCFFIHQNEGNLCDICSNPTRRQDIIMLVEKETDLISLENTGKFNGRYFLLGVIPKTGILTDLQRLRLQSLKNSIEKNLNGQAAEIVLAFNPTSYGDFNSALIEKELKPFTKKISRLSRGLPTGGEIEFADDETLSSALAKRD